MEHVNWKVWLQLKTILVLHARFFPSPSKSQLRPWATLSPFGRGNLLQDFAQSITNIVHKRSLRYMLHAHRTCNDVCMCTGTCTYASLHRVMLLMHCDSCLWHESHNRSDSKPGIKATNQLARTISPLGLLRFWTCWKNFWRGPCPPPPRRPPPPMTDQTKKQTFSVKVGGTPPPAYRPEVDWKLIRSESRLKCVGKDASHMIMWCSSFPYHTQHHEAPLKGHEGQC